MKIGVPSIVSMCSALFIETINSAYVGHLGSEDIMAGVGMANMYMNITCLSVLFGINMTLDTVVSQAFGFGDYRMCGVYLNRSRIIITLIIIPLSLFLLQTETIFNLVGFDKNASHYSQLYINLLIPGLYFLGFLDSNRRFLTNLGYQNGPMYIQVVATALHFLWCYILIDVFELGAAGAGIATTFTNFITMAA